MRSLLWLHFHRSPDCFQIGWPMRLDHDFFFTNPDKEKGTKSHGTAEAKENGGHEDEEMGLKSEGDENEETRVCYIVSPLLSYLV